MTSDKGILIKNVYYMLSYAFQVLKQSNYDEIAAEEFETIVDLFAEILTKGISKQVKQGLHREYVLQRENLSGKRGKLDFPETIKNVIIRKQMLFCEFDELSVNNIYNQILKTTGMILLKHKGIQKDRRNALKKVMLFLHDIDTIDPTSIKWKQLKFHRNNQTYRMLLNLCYFVLEGLLLTTEKGDYKLATFLDDQRMLSLYQNFILKYYVTHFPELRPAASLINWATDDGITTFLPEMQSDIILRSVDNSKVLIIDAKYYAKTMQERMDYGTRSVHSGNLYQIFTYVKNQSIKEKGKVTGMLLYAKTEEEITPDFEYQMSGNQINVTTLDLNVEFKYIAQRLNQIASAVL
jgi:5-methylcytosine-specific restriction enzyme subunit McrC